MSTKIECTECDNELLDELTVGTPTNKVIQDKSILTGDEQLIAKKDWLPYSEMNDVGKILTNEIFHIAFRKIMKLHKPKNKVVFFSLCTATRPYNFGRKWGEFKKHLGGQADLIVLSNGGLIPEKFWTSYPYLNYDSHAQTHDELFYQVGTERIVTFLKKFKYDYVVANFRPETRFKNIMTTVLPELKHDDYIRDFVILPTLEDYEDLKQRDFPGGKMFPDLDEKIFTKIIGAVYDFNKKVKSNYLSPKEKENLAKTLLF